MTTRRSFIKTGATLTLLAPFAQLAAAGRAADSRFVLVILRGGLDAIAAVPPYAEPRYGELRGPIALASPGSGDGSALNLDGTFGLHPALESLHAMFRAREALVVKPLTLLGTGLLVALVSGLPAVLRGQPFLTALWAPGSLPLGTPALFDAGVFLVVAGVVLMMLFTLAEES